MAKDGFKVEFELGANNSEFIKKLDDSEKYARDTKKKIDQELKHKIELNIAEFQFQINQAREALKEARFRDDETNIKLISTQLNQMSRGLTEAKRGLNNLLNTGDPNKSRLGSLFDSVGSGLSRLAGLAGITAGITATAKSVLNLAGTLEQAQIAFTTMLGSGEKAKQFLKELSDFAVKTPFTIQQVRDNAKQLLAMGVAADQVIPVMKSLGDVAAGLSVPIDRLALAYGQVIAKGKLQGGELKQFTEAGVPIIETISKTLGVTTGEFYKMVEAGKISAGQVTQAFAIMSGEGGKFGNLMDAQSKTFKGALSNLSDSFSLLGEVIGGIFIPFLTKAAQFLTSVLGPIRSRIQDNQKLASGIGIVVGVIVSLIGILSGLGLIIGPLTAAVGAFGIGMGALLGPIGLVIGAIAAISGGVVLYNSLMDSVNQTHIDTVIRFSELKDAMEANKKAQDDLTKSYQEGKISQDEYSAKMQELIAAQVDLASATGSTALSNVDLAAAIDYVNTKKIQTEDDIANLQRLAAQARTAANELLKVAEAKLLAEDKQVKAGQRTLVGAGNVAPTSAPVFDAMNLVIAADQAESNLKKRIDQFRATINSSVSAPSFSAGGLSGSGGSKAKKKTEKDEELDLMKDAYKQAKDIAATAYGKINDAIDGSKKKIASYGEEIKKVGQKFIDAKRDIVKSILDINIGLGDLNEKTNTDLQNRYSEVSKQLAELQKKQTSGEGFAEGESKTFNDLTAEKAKLTSLLTAEEIKHAEAVSKLSETEKILLEDEKQRTSLLERRAFLSSLRQSTFNEDTGQINSGVTDFKINEDLTGSYVNAEGQLIKINDIKNTQFAAEQLQKQQLLDEEVFAIQTKQAEEQKSLEALNEVKKRLEDDYQATFKSSIEQQKKSVNDYFNTWVSGINTTSLSMADLISKTTEAIRLQNQLQGAKSMAGFASGGYTGKGGKHDVAGIVHKGEWVAPARMMNGKFRPIIDSLEKSRQRGFASGGFTSSTDNSRTVTQHNKFDIRGGVSTKDIIDYLNWRAKH